MQRVFDELTALMLDPYRRAEAGRDPVEWARAAGLTADQAALAGEARPDQAAGGPWQPCETCWDPGDDPYPEG
jgi:hypothetical protein